MGSCDGVIADWAATLAALAQAPDDADRIDQVRLLENIKAGCAAAQARITAAFAASQRAAHAPATNVAPADSGTSASDRERAGGASARELSARRRERARRLANRSAAAQIALARRESPARGGRYVGLAEALVHEMPGVLSALESGVINEWRATLIVRETACLSREDRAAVDAEIAGRLDGLGDARIEAMVKAIAYRMDPEAATRRSARAERDRRVTLRPKPDVMGQLSGLLPLTSAVACLAALRRAADSHRGDDGRTRDQLMADEFIARLTGIASASPPEHSAAPATVAGAPAPAPATPASAPAHAPATPVGSETPSAAVPSPAAIVAATDPAASATLAGAPAQAVPSPAAAEATPTDAARSSTPTNAAADPVAAVRAAYQRAVCGGAPTREHAPADRSTGAPTREGAAAGRRALGAAAATPAPPGSPAAPPGPHAPSPATLPPGSGIEVCLVISDRTLFGTGSEPALLDGRLPIPAPLARRMLRELPADVNTWIRRLYTNPDTGELVSMDARRRAFSPPMRHLLFTRDHGTCRTPWCNGAARHADHLTPFARGGPTTVENGQSLSEDCNYIRESPGWSASRDPDGSGTITVTTPTGHRYASPAPGLIPGRTRARVDICERRADVILEDLLSRAV